MPDPIAHLMAQLARLPGIGERSAARLAYYIVRCSQKKSGQNLSLDLAQALAAVARDVGFCAVCQNLSAQQICAVCASPKRDRTVLCVVEGASDVRALERSGYLGQYHVLHGALAPLDGVGPEDLKVDALLARLPGASFGEIILATNANVEGDATALYLSHCLQAFDVKVTRLASGMPQGGELEYLDQATLGQALLHRRPF